MRNIIYNEDNIFEIAYWCFNKFDVPEGIEAGDLQFDLLYADSHQFDWAPGYTFTMEEEDEEEDEQ